MTDQTTKNLKDAFAVESQASRRYIAFALKADEEGFHNLARIFRALAESETVHAIRHLECAKGVRSSLENIEESWKGEKSEYSGMYSMFMDQAKRDVNNDALQTFFWANESEKAHADFYKKALESLKQEQDVQITTLQVCTVCGNTLEGDLPDTCPVCGKSRDNYVVVE